MRNKSISLEFFYIVFMQYTFTTTPIVNCTIAAATEVKKTVASKYPATIPAKTMQKNAK